MYSDDNKNDLSACFKEGTILSNLSSPRDE